MRVLDITLLTVAVVLVFYLFVRVRRRLAKELAERLEQQAAAYTGKGLDTAPLHRRVEVVRRNLGSVSRIRRCNDRHRIDLIASAARVLFRFSYFQCRRTPTLTAPARETDQL